MDREKAISFGVLGALIVVLFFLNSVKRKTIILPADNPDISFKGFDPLDLSVKQWQIAALTYPGGFANYRGVSSCGCKCGG